MLLSLERLDFRLLSDYTVDGDRDEIIMAEIVGPFINGTSPSLRELGIASASTKDHSGLFRPLENFPKLRSISLNIGFCPPLLTDQSALTRFLLSHADTLERLELQPIESYHPPSGPEPAYMHFVAWMGQISTEVRLGHLKRLTIAPPPALCDVTTVDIVTPLLLPCKNTLTHLVLRNCYRPFDEVRNLFDLLAYTPGDPGLRSLHLKTLSLNPQLFDYASVKLPDLDDFNIHFDTLLPHADLEYLVIPANPNMEAVDVVPFVRAMKRCRYPEWKLRSLWIFQRSRMTTAMAYDILCLLKKCIPSVESFLGTNFKMVVPAILPGKSE
ncbi:hypothetical protein BD779DRAFT_778045 [Infundibulicybe gibba]|nr:hypothetical protein BD779DRAFT_778045 [Infundibulicybe gibba]